MTPWQRRWRLRGLRVRAWVLARPCVWLIRFLLWWQEGEHGLVSAWVVRWSTRQQAKDLAQARRWLDAYVQAKRNQERR